MYLSDISKPDRLKKQQYAIMFSGATGLK